MKFNLKKIGGVVVSAATFVTASAHAALPAEATTALTNIGTGVTDAEAGAWPIIGAALVAGIVIKLVKRFANKV